MLSNTGAPRLFLQTYSFRASSWQMVLALCARRAPALTGQLFGKGTATYSSLCVRTRNAAQNPIRSNQPIPLLPVLIAARLALYPAIRTAPARADYRATGTKLSTSNYVNWRDPVENDYDLIASFCAPRPAKINQLLVRNIGPL